jgi:Zn-dependent M16 (insulinase) family peptidase
MKGSMSNISSITWQALTKNLFPDLTYKHNSGGDPETIIELTHDYLKGFHKKFYHPSNATYFTWGDVSAKEIQNFIDKKLAQKFKKIDEAILENLLLKF